MIKMTFSSFIILLSLQLAAQSSFKRNTLYAELAGNGGVLTINYERQLTPKQGLGIFLGVGLGDAKPAIPFGARYLFPLKSTKSFIEVGAGITLAEISFWDDKLGHNGYNPFKPGYIPSVSFRHHTNYGLMWRISYTPIFTAYRNIPSFGGFSIGWQF